MRLCLTYDGFFISPLTQRLRCLFYLFVLRLCIYSYFLHYRERVLLTSLIFHLQTTVFSSPEQQYGKVALDFSLNKENTDFLPLKKKGSENMNGDES